MRAVAADLSAAVEDKAQSAARTVARCLKLAKEAVNRTEVRSWKAGGQLLPADCDEHECVSMSVLHGSAELAAYRQ